MHLQLQTAKMSNTVQSKSKNFSISLCCEVKFQLQPVAHKSVRKSYDIKIKE